MTRRECLALAGGCPLAGQSAHDEIQKLSKHAAPELRFRESPSKECRVWQRSFRARLDASFVLRAAGVPDLPVHPLLPRQRSSKRPGILALHGHGQFGHDSVAGIADTPEQKKPIEQANYDYGVELARRGYVVACALTFVRYDPRSV